MNYSFWEAAENLISPFLVLHVGVGVFLSFTSSTFEVQFLICSCCGKAALKKWLWRFIRKAWGLWSFSSLAGDLCEFSIILFSVGCTFSWVLRTKGHQPGCYNFPSFWSTTPVWGWKDTMGWEKPCVHQWWARATHLGKGWIPSCSSYQLSWVRKGL